MKNTNNLKAIDFGTAGIRGIVGKGIDHLSAAHVQRVAHGFVNYLLKKYEKLDKITIVIGRDNRRFSNKYAKLIAKIAASYNKIQVILSRKITPTPFVSYLIISNKAQGGFNITASHNPKEYNGIKLYNEHGSQCLPDEIELIKKEFKDYYTYSDEYRCDGVWPVADNIRNTTKKEWDSYINKVLNIVPNTEFSKEMEKIKVVYSPLHGTGSTLANEIFKGLNLELNKDVFYVKEQFIKDRNFKTCSYPNPERDDVYELGEKLAIKNNCDIVLVTDPDADRVGVKVRDNNKFTLLTGNETATLLMKYLLEVNKENANNKYMVYSYVSSNLPELIAKKSGLKTFIVPTGFKWIGKTIVEQKQEMFFGFEESYGSLIDSSIARDKDAIQSIVAIVKMTQYYKNHGKTLIDALDEIYREYGYIASKSINIDIDQNTDLTLIQEKFKELDLSEKIVQDYNLETDFMKSNMIKISFKNKADWIALRPSGTEPKIKFYIFAYGSNKDAAQKTLDEYISKIETIIN